MNVTGIARHRRFRSGWHQCSIAQHAAWVLLPLTLCANASALAQSIQATPPTTAATGRAGLLPEPPAITRSIEIGSRLLASGDGGDEKNGLYPELGNMVTGAGWISGGPGYRHWLFGDRVFVDGSAAVSWRAYKMIQGRIELTRIARSRVAVGTQARWQDLTQLTYFGEGPDSVVTARSEYRLRSTNVVGYASYRPTRQIIVDGRIGWLTRADIDAPAGTFRRGNPGTRDLFANDPVFQRGESGFIHGELSLAHDTRDQKSYPTRGALYRGAWARYADTGDGVFAFDRYEAEAAQFVPVTAGRVVVGLHGWVVGTDTAANRLVPFYLLPSLGGANTLRSYADYRWHDRALVLVNAEARVALFSHVDTAIFFDAGNVAPRLADLNLDRRSFGVGVRVHSRRATFARLDVARGNEGWRFVFRMNDPLRLARLSRQTAAVPFVP